jgi:hypothetical protein
MSTWRSNSRSCLSGHVSRHRVATLDGLPVFIQCLETPEAATLGTMIYFVPYWRGSIIALDNGAVDKPY